MSLGIQEECEKLHQVIRKMRSDWVLYGDDRLLPDIKFETTSLARGIKKLREELADIVPAEKLDALERHVESQFVSWMNGFPIVKEAWDKGFKDVLDAIEISFHPLEE